jgi:hypothetical protein
MIWIFLGIFWLIGKISAEWNYESIGDVNRVEFYYEKEELKGVWVVSEEGSMAMLEPKDGSIIWRRHLIDDSVAKLTSQEHCNFFLTLRWINGDEEECGTGDKFEGRQYNIGDTAAK